MSTISIACWVIKLIKDILIIIGSVSLFIIGHIILVLTFYTISFYFGYDWIWQYFKKIYGIWCLYYAFINPIYNILKHRYQNKNK